MNEAFDIGQNASPFNKPTLRIWRELKEQNPQWYMTSDNSSQHSPEIKDEVRKGEANPQ